MIPLKIYDKNNKTKHIFRKIPGWFQQVLTFNMLIDLMPNDDFIFVEVGSFMGKSVSYFTVESMDRIKKGKIYAIDTFDGSEEHLDPDNESFIPQLLDNPDYLYQQYLRFTKPIQEHINTIRSTSVEASKQFNDNSIDALYLDAAHDYDNVLADINAWYPKMKKEQLLLTGDDWEWPGVRSAVIDFTRDNGLCLLFPEANTYIITNFEFIETYNR